MKTKMKTKKNPKGAGRPVGSVSYICVKLSELNRVLNPDAVVRVNSEYKPLFTDNGSITQDAKVESV